MGGRNRERERSKTDARERERNALSENEMRVIGREGRYIIGGRLRPREEREI